LREVRVKACKLYTGSNPVLTAKIKNMKEVVIYVLSSIFILFMSFGLFGAFDKDKDNPFK
jgi:hypothetical protein